MRDYQKYINALRKCAKEHENDTTFTGHIVVSDICRDTADLLEKLEQEPIINKKMHKITYLHRKYCASDVYRDTADLLEELEQEYKTERLE